MKRLLLLPVLMFGISFPQTNEGHIDIIVRSGYMSDFCKTKTVICPNNQPSHTKYNGMQGRLVLAPVAEEFGKSIYRINMKDGSTLFYSTRNEDIFGKGSNLVKLSSHLKVMEGEGQSIIDGGKVIIEKITINDYGIGYKYHLSTGQVVWGDTLRSLRSLLPHIPREYEERFVNMIEDIRINYDNVEDRFFISIKNTIGGSNNKLAVAPYVGFQDGKAWLRFKFDYSADNWLFIKKVLVKADETKKNYENLSFERDHSSDTIWEWHDKPASNEDIELIEDIISSDETIVRFYGKQYYNDRTISSKQKQQLKGILWIYEILQ